MTMRPFHGGRDFVPTLHDEIVDLYGEAQSFARAHILTAPILLLDEDVALDPDRFVVRGDFVHVLGDQALTPVNFAVCWNDESIPEDSIIAAGTVGVAHFLVPPILHAKTAGCHHLRFDFFRNTWMVDHRQHSISILQIISEGWAEPDPGAPLAPPGSTSLSSTAGTR
jgi:hypothetical protein